MIGKYKAILIFGPPGVGKGTQAKLIAQNNPSKYFHFSTGDMFRSLKNDPVMAESELAKKINETISGGNLVSDDLTVELLFKTLEEYSNSKKFNRKEQILILDGIPRNPAQADLISSKIEVLKIISLVIKDDKVLIERLKSRAINENRKDDSDVNIIKKRLDIYKKETLAVLAKYPPSLILKIDGLPSIEEISKEISKKLR